MAVFLMENGVLSMVNKTPVTILQETLQRRGLNPDYELIYNGTGTMDPIFKFQVSAAGHTAIGEGKTKREAKHDAAAALLKRMNLTKAVTENCDVESAEEVDIVSPYSRAIKENFVGMLDEVCVINKIPLPVFTPTSEAGPPHARVFTMECRVASIIETAMARTKKQAKHLVAQQMISRVAEILGDMYISPADRLIGDLEEVGNLRAIESGTFRHDMSKPIAMMHDVFHNGKEEFPLPQIFVDLPSKPEDYYRSLEKPKEFLDELLQSLDGTCRIAFTSKSQLQEAFKEIEKDCQELGFYFEDDEEEEEVTGDDKESEVSSEDENIGTLNSVLQEFKLEEDDDESTTSDSDSLFIKQLEHEFVSLFASENVPVSINGSQLNSDAQEKKSLLHPVSVFLTIECPQGVWSFLATEETNTEAVDKAAVKALLFLRTMAVPIVIKTETDTIDDDATES